MAIYIWGLIVGFEVSGVDTAIAARHRYLSSIDMPINYFFNKAPEDREIELYSKMGIPVKYMNYLEAAYVGMRSLEGTVDPKMKAEELFDSLCGERIDYSDNGCEIIIVRRNEIVAIIHTRNSGAAVATVSYFSRSQLVARETYYGRLLYVDYYFEDNVDIRSRCYYDENGNVSFEVFDVGNKNERFVFNDGRVINRYELYVELFDKLNINNSDISILDRPSFMDYVAPIMNECLSKKVVFLHSLHYMKANESAYGIYVNHEYFNYYKNANKFDCFVVSSELQKKELAEKLIEYGRPAKRIEVIPASGIKEIKVPNEERIPYSIITTSRLDLAKQTNLLIGAVVKAHEKNPDIVLDIYGDGVEFDNLKRLIASKNAEGYVRMMGYSDVSELYKKYEVYASMSAYETYGISLLDAVGSGEALVGLNVRYGNNIFIQDGKNGYLVDYDLDRKYDEEYLEELQQIFSDRLVDLFDDRDRLISFQNMSYELSKNFLEETLVQSWNNLLLPL